MVYEARQGQTFLLGASTWRIEEITRDRVLVSPAPGIPGAVPFWKGEGIGRPFELGREIGRTARELVALDDEAATARLTGEHALDDRAAANLLTFLREQESATARDPFRPHDRRGAVPGRDRRLAPLRPDTFRRSRARALVTRPGRPLARHARARSQLDLVRRRHRAAPPRRGRPAGDRRPPDRSRRSSRSWSSPSSPEQRSSEHDSARMPPGRFSSRAAGRGSERRCGSSGSRLKRCCR